MQTRSAQGSEKGKNTHLLSRLSLGKKEERLLDGGPLGKGLVVGHVAVCIIMETHPLPIHEVSPCEPLRLLTLSPPETNHSVAELF